MHSQCPTLLNLPQSSTHSTLCNVSAYPYLPHQSLTPLISSILRPRTPNMLASRLALNLRIYNLPVDPVLVSDPDSSSRVISEMEFPSEANAVPIRQGQQESRHIGATPDRVQWFRPLADCAESDRSSDRCCKSRLVSKFSLMLIYFVLKDMFFFVLTGSTAWMRGVRGHRDG